MSPSLPPITMTLFALTIAFCNHSCAQPLNQKKGFTHQDTLRGSIGPGRDWWDVKNYNLSINVDINTKTIRGSNQITYAVVKPGKNKLMQIDLQEPMEIEKVEEVVNKEMKPLPFKREGNVYWVDFGERNFPISKTMKDENSILVTFKGKPREAVNPPWDGGWIWSKDEKARPWITVACQGLGASVWYPCKDHQSDEPDQGAILSVRVPDSLVVVANGKDMGAQSVGNGIKQYTWRVENPINNYNIVPYIGKYVSWGEEYKGEKGDLFLQYWVLDYNKEKAKKQFDRDVKRMLKAFEYWFGPYPFYEDGYKLVESSHLGMEHQSATAYGNHFMDGYLGMDLSGSGWGKKWDYIIIHESGHEWFANNITTKDIADMWVHEGFTMYSEVLFTEYYYGKEAGDAYLQGIRRQIRNDKPLIGPYGVNQEGSGDMYNKGASLLHTIRQVIDDDERFREILRGLNKEFYHTTVDSKDVEVYFSKKAGKDLSKIFDQYLRTTKIPVLEYKITGDNLSYRWANVVDDFSMPVKLAGSSDWLKPTTNWQQTTITEALMKDFKVDKNFYVQVKKMD